MLENKREAWNWRLHNLMNVYHHLERLCEFVNHNFGVQRTPDASNFRQKTLNLLVAPWR
jgi:hypothetical protein